MSQLLEKKCAAWLTVGKKYRRREWSPKKKYYWVWYEYVDRDAFGNPRHMLYRDKGHGVCEWIDLMANNSLILVGNHKVQF